MPIPRHVRKTLAAVVTGTLTLSVPHPADADTGAVRCQNVSVTVPARVVATARIGLRVPLSNWTVRARLCVPRGAETIELLLSGATYGSRYWDFGYRPATYSYVRYATAHGRATLNVERLGTDASSHPAPELLTTATQARMTHLLIWRLRTGGFGYRFRHVVLTGHSYGSIVAIAEAGAYHDADALVLTALTHQYGSGLATQFAPSLAPASLVDPAFRRLPPGYLTTDPGTRSQFYYLPGADPAVIARDEATKQTLADGEGATFPTELFSDGPNVTAPVLAVVGDHDYMLCGLPSRCADPLSLTGTERAFFPRARSYRLAIIPGAGHALNLHRDAPLTYALIGRWLSTEAF
jgi:hypothetical protein